MVVFVDVPFEVSGRRSPQQGIGIIDEELDYTGGVPFPRQTVTLNIAGGHYLFKYAIVSVTINNAIAYGSEVVLEIGTSSEIFAKYTIPTGQAGQVIYDTVQIQKQIQNPNQLRMVHGGLAAGGASNYTIKTTFFFTEL